MNESVNILDCIFTSMRKNKIIHRFNDSEMLSAGKTKGKVSVNSFYENR